MAEWVAFADQLRRTGRYATPVGFRGRVRDRWLGRFDGYYHGLIAYRVWSCGARAKRQGLEDGDWAERSLAVLHCVERCGGSVRIEMPAGRLSCCTPCVYVANHMSVLETLLLPCILLPFGHPTIVVKEDLLRYPGLCHTLKAVDPIAVTRRHPRRDLKTVLTRGRESLSAGKSVLVFPQSTRRVAFDPGTFNSLGAKLAARSGVPVVPIALKTDFSGLGPVVKEFGRIDRTRTVHFRFGQPLDAAADQKRTHADTVAFIAGALREWGGTVVGDEPG